MIEEVNTARDVALLAIDATLEAASRCVSPRPAKTVIAQPGFAVLLAYNPGLLRRLGRSSTLRPPPPAGC